MTIKEMEKDVLEYIYHKTSERSLYEQLAEEASELSQAALKIIRTFGNTDNPTTVGFYEAFNNIREELTDVLLVCDLLEIDKQDDVYLRKLYRWHERIKENEKSKEQGKSGAGNEKEDGSEV